MPDANDPTDPTDPTADPPSEPTDEPQEMQERPMEPEDGSDPADEPTPDSRLSIGDDLSRSLERFFSPNPGRRTGTHLVADLDDQGRRIPAAEDENTPIGDAPLHRQKQTSAVAWRYYGIDDKGVNGLAPTKNEIVIRGVTVFAPANDATGEGSLYHRYIDWLDVYAQLGLALGGRPVVDPLKSVVDDGYGGGGGGDSGGGDAGSRGDSAEGGSGGDSADGGSGSDVDPGAD
jgi:hypothetical protein